MKKLLIVSSDEILLYQPTILNLYDLLCPDFSVEIISFEPSYLGRRKDESRKVHYIRYNPLLRGLLRGIELSANAVFKRLDSRLFRFPFRLRLIIKYRETLLRKCLGTRQADEVIAADMMPLYVCQQVFGRVHFLSLELLPDDPYRNKINDAEIKSLIIQNEARSAHLFGNRPMLIFYIQNAPFLNMMHLNTGERKGLVWAGTVVKNFGVLHCLDFIRKYPGYQLTLKGGVEKHTGKEIQNKYSDLINAGRLVIDITYLEAEPFIAFLSSFSIGFCFYEWDLIRSNFNYQTAPSGKLFMYLAAGVPVIASDIPAFQFVKEMGAGELVADYSPETLKQAIDKIESNFQEYSNNAYAAFRSQCFDNGAIPFRDYLLSGN